MHRRVLAHPGEHQRQCCVGERLAQMRADEDKVIVAYEGCAIARRPPALGAFSAPPSWPDQFCRKFVAAGRAKRGGNRIFIGLMMNIAVISILLWGRKLRQSGLLHGGMRRIYRLNRGRSCLGR